ARHGADSFLITAPVSTAKSSNMSQTQHSMLKHKAVAIGGIRIASTSRNIAVMITPDRRR
ncbi:hypothetical protein ACC699_35670, partial [Rhizobium ruizarguesonis]